IQPSRLRSGRRPGSPAARSVPAARWSPSGCPPARSRSPRAIVCLLPRDGRTPSPGSACHLPRWYDWYMTTSPQHRRTRTSSVAVTGGRVVPVDGEPIDGGTRSEEHTSELQSRENLVCRLLLEKKK